MMGLVCHAVCSNKFNLSKCGSRSTALGLQQNSFQRPTSWATLANLFIAQWVATVKLVLDTAHVTQIREYAHVIPVILLQIVASVGAPRVYLAALKVQEPPNFVVFYR